MSKKHKPAETETVFDEITRRCADAGISVRSLFQKIGKKDANLMQKWKKKDPESITTYRLLDKELKDLKA